MTRLLALCSYRLQTATFRPKLMARRFVLFLYFYIRSLSVRDIQSVVRLNFCIV